MTYIKGVGNMFESGAEALVNAVNCVGVMGGGLAKVFADTFPFMEQDYINYCNAGLLIPGRIHTYYSNLINDPWVINFPSKDDWRDPSLLQYIQVGMTSLCYFVNEMRIRSVAIPALGCGLGGLDWNDVKPVILHHITALPDVDWTVYDPQ